MSDVVAAQFLDKALDHLRRHVALNSFTRNRAGVVAVGDLTAELFAPLGFRATRVPSITPECGDHLTLTRRAGPDAPHLVMVSHLDTVFPPDMEFSWREDDGDWVVGPGVCDIKGGTVLMWMVLSTLQASDAARLENTSWTLLLNATEEGGCDDFPDLARAACARPNTRACLVYEAGMEAGAATTLVTQRKGCGRFRLTARGHPAHSGNAHEQGASAIRELARAVEKVEQLTDYDAGQTLSVGLIRGGSAVNSISETASADIDVRSWTVEAEQEAERKLQAIANEATVASADGKNFCRMELRRLPGYPPWAKNDASDNLGALAARCARDLGQAIAPGARRGGSDGCHTWDLVPTLDGLGPIGRATHTLQEAVKTSSFVPRTMLSVRLIEALLTGECP